MEMNKELLAKAKEAKTPDELMSLAKENGIELTAESAASYFDRLNSKTGELSDSELDNVSGGCGGGYGNYVIIDHGNEFITLYGHLSEVDVEIGDEVKKGDVIGKMGSTGFSTGDHLHIEIRYQGYILNPAFYLDVTQ